MTKNIDMPTMTSSRKVLSQYREQLEIKIKDKIIWAMRQNAITVMTKTVRENDPSSLP